MWISEFSSRTGASVRSLRYYEQKDLIFSERSENGYRDFDDSQIERVSAIQFYLGLGLSIIQIRRIMNCKGKSPLPEHTEKHELCEPLLLLYEEKLGEIDEQIELLAEARTRLKERISLFKKARKVAEHHLPLEADPQ